MNIFISWSGDLSKQCAEILRDWIKCTLQASEPWISSQDIDKGTLWFNEINDKLKDTKIGIVCLTRENKDKPWILFESGALAKGLSTNKVCTFLIDLKPADLENPLAQFNCTVPEKQSIKGLLSTINKELDERKLEDRILDQVFETNWPNFEDNINKIRDTFSIVKDLIPQRSEENILEEILITSRSLNKRVQCIENILGKKSVSLGTFRGNINSLEDEEYDFLEDDTNLTPPLDSIEFETDKFDIDSIDS